MHVRALCGRETSDDSARQLVELAVRGAQPHLTVRRNSPGVAPSS